MGVSFARGVVVGVNNSLSPSMPTQAEAAWALLPPVDWGSGTVKVADTDVQPEPSGTDVITTPDQLVLWSASLPSGPLVSLAMR